MKNKKHQKHAKLARPDLGYFARNEWSIIGTPCGNIKKIAYQVTENLSRFYKVAYVDADHPTGEPELKVKKGTAMDFGASMVYTDKITHHRFEKQYKYESNQYRTHFYDQDLVLINGNHFTGQKQIVVVDPRKFESLERKIDRLTNVFMVLLEDGVDEIPAFIKAKIEHLDKIPVYKTSETKLVSAYIKDYMEDNTPLVSGLILAGGKSNRMGQDKGLINYQGKPHREYLHHLVNSLVEDVFISCRHDQLTSVNGIQTLPDSFFDLGPYGALLSAFRFRPDHAWLVVACDYPLMDHNTILQLLTNRNTSKFATAFQSTENEFPEPLITIWEPRSYPELLRFLGQGYSCPRKVLINTDIQLLTATNPDALRNVNSPEEMQAVMDQLKMDS